MFNLSNYQFKKAAPAATSGEFSTAQDVYQVLDLSESAFIRLWCNNRDNDDFKYLAARLAAIYSQLTKKEQQTRKLFEFAYSLQNASESLSTFNYKEAFEQLVIQISLL